MILSKQLGKPDHISFLIFAFYKFIDLYLWRK